MFGGIGGERNAVTPTRPLLKPLTSAAKNQTLFHVVADLNLRNINAKHLQNTRCWSVAVLKEMCG